MDNVAGRIAAGVAAVLLWLGWLFGAIIALFVAASAAEPGHVTERGETLTAGVVLGLLEGALLAGALVLSIYAASGRFAFWRPLAAVPLLGSLALGVLAGLSL